MPTPAPNSTLPAYEKLGAFYLGKGYDLASKLRTDDLLLYDSRDLVTHAVCVGMTGSGKTGLCLGLLEEAAIDGIPSIIIDPKGDLSNLLLTFPGISAAEFRPWINEDDARREGISPDEFASKQAALWAKGLKDWDQDGTRIQRLRDSAEFAIYTPGSTAGRRLSVLKSFDAPPAAVLDDAEVFGERVSATVTGLLGLMGIDADPLQSREHILLSSILSAAWQDGKNVDLAALIAGIQKPPIQRVGVMDVETFFPSQERFALAMRLNALVASPGFSRWLDGEPLDIASLLYTPAGKPRVAIMSIAHLPDAERMFFVSLLLTHILSWVRTQSGTTSLRALVYMDEIAGYFPPVANPPSKKPLLTLMKQARAFGVGVVVATQNPVDLDYKGLANAGTWFIGRLQTDRDKQRVLDGLEGAAANAAAKFDRATMDTMLSSLGPRVFLMNNVHEDEPVVFTTRWCLSYLRGPLTREQIKRLTDEQPAIISSKPASVTSPAAASTPSSGRINITTASTAPAASARPVLPPDVPQFFVPSRASGPLVYVPMLLGSAKIYYSDAKLGVDEELSAAWLVPLGTGAVVADFDHAARAELSDKDLESEPASAASFESLPADAAKPKNYDAWKKQFGDMVYRTAMLELFSHDELELTSTPGEKEAAFRARLAQLLREQRDAAVDKLRAKYAPKLATLQDRIRRAQQAAEVQRAQASSAKLQSVVSIGAAILSAFTGRKIASSANIGRAATAARGVSRIGKESSDVGRAEENIEALQAQLAALEEQFNTECATLGSQHNPQTDELSTLTVKPKKSGISVRAVVLAWTPHVKSSDGELAAAW
jgi:hypothetical protein